MMIIHGGKKINQKVPDQETFSRNLKGKGGTSRSGSHMG